jgi:photosystem II stability/assembly factor-like uncharacterized protein
MKIKTVIWSGRFNFVDERMGWVVAHADRALALLRTGDGGKTWQALNPKIAP